MVQIEDTRVVGQGEGPRWLGVWGETDDGELRGLTRNKGMKYL